MCSTSEDSTWRSGCVSGVDLWIPQQLASVLFLCQLCMTYKDVCELNSHVVSGAAFCTSLQGPVPYQIPRPGRWGPAVSRGFLDISLSADLTHPGAALILCWWSGYLLLSTLVGRALFESFGKMHLVSCGCRLFVCAFSSCLFIFLLQVYESSWSLFFENWTSGPVILFPLLIYNHIYSALSVLFSGFQERASIAHTPDLRL